MLGVEFGETLTIREIKLTKEEWTIEGQQPLGLCECHALIQGTE